jgi:hypothetical protein
MTDHNFIFLPTPRQVTWREGTFVFTSAHLVLLDPRDAQALRFT